MKNSYGHKALRTSVRLALAAIAVSSIPFSVSADDQLDAITVTANRMPSVNVLAATTVITRADIERLQINNLPSLLSRQAGIDMTASGGLGKVSSISIRGTNSDHVLVLVDGVKWHSATSGGASIQDFPVEQIERIEIVRGSRSGLYGSEAIGGVIQIFTRQGQQGFTPYSKVSYGSHNSKQFAAGVSGGNEATTYNLSFNHQSTEGINARTDKNPDKDGYRNNSISAKIQHTVNDRFSIGANFLRSEGFNEYDGFDASDNNKGESIQQIFGVNAKLAINDKWSLTLNVGESKDEAQDYVNSIENGTFNTRRQFASLINTVAITKNHTLSIGLDYEEDKVTSSTDYSESSRDNKAVFVSWQAQFDKSSWLVAARYDDNEAFGSHNTGMAEWGYWLQDNLQFSLNYGSAFKAPTFNDLYWPVTSYFQGNPDLQPERSNSFSMNLDGNQAWGNWGFHLYNTHIRNLLVYQFPQMENVNKAKIAGVEFDADTQLLGWDIAVNATFLKPEDLSTGNILARRAQRLANVNIDKQWGQWSTGASWKLRGHSFDNASNSTRLGGYGLLDLRVSYKIDSDWSIQANVKNLFDKEYQTVNNYNSLDRTGMITLSYTP
ncbi:MAG: TonB-dependent receptor [Piscirickettsiaceae bacterium]|nr:TonB-dependent receptor [Piscirickettsiaceae bacterium]